MQQQQDREVYPLLAGRGCASATDSATATRHKMEMAVEARIISNVGKVVEIWARGLCRNERMAVTSTYWRKGMGEQQLENSSGIMSSFLYSLFCTLDDIHLQSPPVISMSEDIIILT